MADVRQRSHGSTPVPIKLLKDILKSIPYWLLSCYGDSWRDDLKIERFLLARGFRGSLFTCKWNFLGADSSQKK